MIQKMKVKIVVLIFLGLISSLISGIIIGVYLGRSRGIPFVDMKEDWSIGVYFGEDPFNFVLHENISNPVLTNKDITDISSGGFCFKPINVSKEDTPYFLLEPLQDDFRFKNDVEIQDIIIQQIFDIEKNEDKQREEYRKIIETENLKQKSKEDKEYQKIRDEIDSLKI